ncbi:Exosome complex exonuclease [Pelomyxa schiedti]|nr:Exosome complex exonuclease [Pelomyxa schiedti]
MVVPGDVIAPGGGSLYMRGHGTFLGGDNNDDIMASVSGMVERVDKLICVRSLRCRYLGEIGDVVVGRVTQVGQGKWRVDVNSRVDAVLLLSSIDLPGGVLRKRTYSDELNMRTFYAENDLICAEVHSLSGNGAMNLQTRSHRYGKLLNGIFMAIPPTLIKRSKSHMHTFDFGVSVIFGNNGYIWIYVTADPLGAVHGDPTQAAQEEQPTAHSETTPTSAENPPPATTPTTNPQPYRPTPAEQIEMRTRLARVRNSVSTLASVHCWVHPDAVSAVYQESLLQKLTPKEMLNPALWASLTEPARTSAVDLYAVSSS